MKVYVEKIETDATGKKQYEFIEVKDLIIDEINFSTLSALVENLNAKVDNVKSTYDKVVARLNTENAQIKKALMSLITAILEVKKE